MPSPKFILFFALIAFSTQLHAQVIVTSEKTVTGPIQQTQRGKVKPLFWKAIVDKQIAFVRIADIESFGMQEFAVDNAAYVRELTISLKSRNFVRIYHIEPRNSPSGYVNDAVENLTGRLGEIQGAVMGDDGQRVSPVIKSYPTTTHKEMIEYRVIKKQTIADLYKHLEQTYIDHHAADLVAGQRPQTIVEVKVETGGSEE